MTSQSHHHQGLIQRSLQPSNLELTSAHHKSVVKMGQVSYGAALITNPPHTRTTATRTHAPSLRTLTLGVFLLDFFFFCRIYFTHGGHELGVRGREAAFLRRSSVVAPGHSEQPPGPQHQSDGAVETLAFQHRLETRRERSRLTCPYSRPAIPGRFSSDGKPQMFQHPVRLFWPRSKSFDYLYSDGEALLRNFPVQATISFYEDSDSDDDDDEEECDEESEEEKEHAKPSSRLDALN
ncbi:protein ripply1 [Boleophthalmus pectinirostris]|uniref:protein ripply1 n=1 Tax=Boleophthalmus pectinirostris TaxID=150288 RepID=UPI00242E4430|nr:protein ripply1 [Boleophthalmus pectinirostris]